MSPLDAVTPPAPAQGVRLAWEQLPAHVQNAVGAVLGSPVVAATTQPGGFSPGVAARVVTAEGRRAFVKAVSAAQNPDSPGLHRREARVAAALPAEAPVPRLIASYDDGDWVALVFADVEGRQPELPWLATELGVVLEAVARLHEALTPAGAYAVPDVDPELGRLMACWERLAAEPALVDRADPWSRRHLDRLAALARGWAAGVAGDTLLHLDLRADNLLLTGGGAMVVDWPWATRGAAWVDVALMAPCVAAQGGPPPDALMAGCRSSAGTPVAALLPFVAGLAGYFTYAALQPAPPGLPTVRAFQAMQGRAARAWVAQLTGWA